MGRLNHHPQTGKPVSHSATPELLQLLNFVSNSGSWVAPIRAFHELLLPFIDLRHQPQHDDR
jgi:hypothetical protein